MNKSTRKVIDTIYEGRVDIKEPLYTSISQKAIDILEARKVEIAKSLFKESTPE